MKNSQPSIPRKKAAKSCARRNMDNDLSLFRDWPISKDHAIHFVKDLLLMMKEDPKMKSLIRWREKHGLTTGVVSDLCKKYPEFKTAYLEAKDRMGWRRLDGAADKEQDPSITKFILPYFSQDFKDMEEWRSSMKAKQEEAKKPNITIVEIPTIQPSGLVPDKEKEDAC